MRETQFSIKLTLPDWPAQEQHREISESIITLWEQIGEHFKRIPIITHLGDISIDIDWEPAITTVKKDYIVVHNHKIPAEGYPEWDGYVKAMCYSSFDVEDETSVRFICHYIENYFYYLFLGLNISSPGAFSLYNTKIEFAGKTIDFKLDSGYFFHGWMSAIDHGWPSIKNIPIINSMDWVQRLNIGTKQIARNRMERVLFALLNLSQQPDFSPMSLIWLAHSLEALFDTPSESVSKVLKERIFLTLGEPKNNTKVIKKALNEFYGLRSRFVHGDFPINLPGNNTVFDDELWSYFEELNESESFALSIIIALLQKLVLNSWTDIQFFEVFSGAQNGV